nr:hypothetical protein [Tanacetum cinerariifolium]
GSRCVFPTFPIVLRPFKTLCFFNYALILRQDYDVTSSLRRGALQITKSSARSDLHFDDEDDITCLTITEIFENLQLMGYEKLSDKLTFLKPLFFPQWKYLIHTILQCLSSKPTTWNEFGTNIASAVICLAKNQKFNFSKLIFDGMLRNLDPNSKKFLTYLRFLQVFLNNEIKNLEIVFNDEYDTPSHTKKVFANMRRKGKDFSGTVTPLFPSMLASQVVAGKGLGQPTEPQHIPTTASPSHVEPIPTVASSSHPKKTYKCRKSKGKVTEIPQSSEPTILDTDKAVHEERGDSGSPRCQEAMWDTIAQTRSERVSTPSYDSSLLGVNTPGSDEKIIKLKELMDLCTKLSDRVLDLENVKDAQALEIKRVYKPRVKSSKESLDEKDESKHRRNSDKTKELNVAEDEHMFDLSDLAGTKVIIDQEEPAELVEDKGSAKKSVSAAEDKDSTAVDVSVGSPTRLVDDSTTNDVTLAETLMAIRISASRSQKLKGFFSKSQKAKGSKKRTRAALGEESVKRQKVKDDAEKAKLKACLEIVPNDDTAVNIESLATKYPIVD